jgi:hypothetical protein
LVFAFGGERGSLGIKVYLALLKVPTQRCRN